MNNKSSFISLDEKRVRKPNVHKYKDKILGSMLPEEILHKLHSRGAVTVPDMSYVNNVTGIREQSSRLLEKVVEKGEDAILDLVKVLDDTQQEHVSNVIDLEGKTLILKYMYY